MSPSIHSKVFLSRLKSSTKALEASLEFRPLRIRWMGLSEHFQCRWRCRSYRSTITQSLRSATLICWWSDRPTIFRHSLGSQVSSKRTALFENLPKSLIVRIQFYHENSYETFLVVFIPNVEHLLGCTMELIFYRNAEAISLGRKGCKARQKLSEKINGLATAK